MSKAVLRLQKVLASLSDIDYILTSVDFKVTQAVEDRIMKPAIRMHIVKIAEQFAKLKDENAFKLLEAFDPEDLRGLSAVRNYIAHDYDSVDDGIIEDVVRMNLPKIKSTVVKLLKDAKRG